MSKPLRLHAGDGMAIDVESYGEKLHFGTAAPTNGGAGFSPGCLWGVHQAWNEATTFYINTGTNTECHVDRLGSEPGGSGAA